MEKMLVWLLRISFLSTFCITFSSAMSMGTLNDLNFSETYFKASKLSFRLNESPLFGRKQSHSVKRSHHSDLSMGKGTTPFSIYSKRVQDEFVKQKFEFGALFSTGLGRIDDDFIEKYYRNDRLNIRSEIQQGFLFNVGFFKRWELRNNIRLRGELLFTIKHCAYSYNRFVFDEFSETTYLLYQQVRRRTYGLQFPIFFEAKFRFLEFYLGSAINLDLVYDYFYRDGDVGDWHSSREVGGNDLKSGQIVGFSILVGGAYSLNDWLAIGYRVNENIGDWQWTCHLASLTFRL